MEWPFVSIILPVRNEEKYIIECTKSIFAQDYPRECMEVIFVDGCSTDKTVAMLETLKQTYSQIRILHNPNKTVPYAMNIGIKACKGPYIVRLDAHATYGSDYVSLSVRTLMEKDCDNAGGVFVTRGRGFWGEAIAAGLCTPFGVGNATYRLETRDGYVDTVPFGAFKKELFDRIGLYDERLTRNQDNELNYRIRKNGGKIYLDRRIRVHYYCRDSLHGIMNMGFQNGKWNVITMLLCPGSMGLRHFVPLLFVLSTLGLLALTAIFGPAFFGTLLGFEWGAYLLLDFFYAYLIAKEKGVRFFFAELIFYPAFHFAYGFGSLRGITMLPRFMAGKRDGR